MIARRDPGIFNFFGFDTSINNRGQVAFAAELDNFDEGLFSGSGGGIRTYYLASTSPFGGSDSRPSLNDLGQVAFFEFLVDDGTGVFRSSGQGFVTIAGEALSPDSPSLNIRGTVAFTASFAEGDEFVQAIMSGNGGPLTTVADTTGPFAFSMIRP